MRELKREYFWGGFVPLGWEVVKAKHVLLHHNREVQPEDDVVTAFRDGQVTLRTNRRTEGFTSSTKEIGYHHVCKGDLVVHSMDGGFGAIGVSDSDGKASPVVHTYTSDAADLYFVAYQLRTAAALGWIAANGKGIRVRSTQFDRPLLNEIDLALPPLPTQRAIADYLDRETAEIDGMRADLDEMERLLEERREAIVADLLLKNPSAVYVSLGLLFTLEDHLRVPVKAGDRKEMAGNVPYYGASGVIDYVSKPIWADCTRLLVSEDGANLALRNHPIAFTARGDFWVNNHAHILRENQQHSYALAAAGISVTDISGFLSGSAQPKLTAESMSRIKVPWLNNPSERRSLVTEIDRETAEIDSMLEDITKLRNLLAERRAAVISAAVTGQIDIPVSPTHKDEPHA